MLAHGSSNPRPATVEEWDEETQTTVPNTRSSAYVAATRSKADLASTTSSRSRGASVEGGTNRTKHTSTTIQDDPSGEKSKKPSGLKLDTSYPRRESRPYSSGPLQDRPRRNSSRPAARLPTSKGDKAEKTAKGEILFRHPHGACWICDDYGYHDMAAHEAQLASKDPSLSQPPATASAQPSQPTPQPSKTPESSAVRPRQARSHSTKEQRPMSFHGGMLLDAYQSLSSQPFSSSNWNMPPTPISAYGQPPYVQTPSTPLQNYYPEFRQPPPNQYAAHQTQAAHRPRPQSESYRNPSVRDDPIIQQSPVLRDQPALSRTISSRERRPSQEPPRSNDEDARRMPPPQIIPVQRRPSMVKAKTSSSNPAQEIRERRYSMQGSSSAASIARERRTSSPHHPTVSHHLLLIKTLFKRDRLPRDRCRMKSQPTSPD